MGQVELLGQEALQTPRKEKVPWTKQHYLGGVSNVPRRASAPGGASNMPSQGSGPGGASKVPRGGGNPPISSCTLLLSHSSSASSTPICRTCQPPREHEVQALGPTGVFVSPPCVAHIVSHRSLTMKKKRPSEPKHYGPHEGICFFPPKQTTPIFHMCHPACRV